MSVLLQREPFGQIVETALSGFWQMQHNREFSVHWSYGRPKSLAHRNARGQLWLVNIYLNAIFTISLNQLAFEPVLREYSRSPVWWQRPFQSLYVCGAINPLLAPWLAQACLLVSPPIPRGTRLLLIAGNHKLRLLDWEARQSVGIVKSDWDKPYMKQELETRHQASGLGLPVPRILEIGDSGTWFRESYLAGTPINRLAGRSQANRAVNEVANYLRRLIERTVQQESVEGYLDPLCDRIRELIAASLLLPEHQKRTMLQSTEYLRMRILNLGRELGCGIMTALVHGDFHPANMLVNSESTWLIDWEYSGRRQAGYDLLVFILRSRFPKDLAKRLQVFLASEYDLIAITGQSSWPGLYLRSASHRQMHIELFLLEELLLNLQENSNPEYTSLTESLILLQYEITEWSSLAS